VVLTDISPDGKFLVCQSGGVILIVPLTGSDPQGRKAIEYLRGESTYGFARLSPDGRFVAFPSDEIQAERFEVYVKPFDTSAGAAADGDQKWRVSKDGTLGMLSWREDSKEIFFRGLNLESTELDVMAVDVNATHPFRAGTPRLLFKLPGTPGGSLGNISRDGQRFVFAIDVPAQATASAKNR
jgi:Tol biopolymer transport system component